MENVDFHDFLDRMRNPAAADLVRSIKSFIINFSSNPPDPEKDSKNVQEFMSNMEGMFRVHPLWTGATDEEIESSGEGLEKYLMTKLFNRAFAPLPEDAEHDQKISEKICLLQQFIKPEHLDIPPDFRNETSWLLAQKELQKINTYKAPRDKLVCILNCCRVINNLLLNATMSSNGHPPGADDFLPVLIYVTMKANPPQLHSNLLYIQRYRHNSRLVSEAAYFYTNLVSAESFIENLEASSISMEEGEFEIKMQAANEVAAGAKKYPHSVEPVPSAVDITHSNQTASQKVQRDAFGVSVSIENNELTSRTRENVDNQGPSFKFASEEATTSIPKISHSKVSITSLEAKGALAVLHADRTGRLGKDYPFLYASVGDLRVQDVETLLNEYKELVLRYYSLCKTVEEMTVLDMALNAQVDGVPRRDGNPGKEALNEDSEGSQAVLEIEAPVELSILELDQQKSTEKYIESTMEQNIAVISPIAPPGDLNVLEGLTIHSAKDVMHGEDSLASLGSGEFMDTNVSTQEKLVEGSVDCNSDLHSLSVTDTVKISQEMDRNHNETQWRTMDLL
eukprot:c26861_g1_i1 orf=524-2221(-)